MKICLKSITVVEAVIVIVSRIQTMEPVDINHVNGPRTSHFYSSGNFEIIITQGWRLVTGAGVEQMKYILGSTTSQALKFRFRQ